MTVICKQNLNTQTQQETSLTYRKVPTFSSILPTTESPGPDRFSVSWLLYNHNVGVAQILFGDLCTLPITRKVEKKSPSAKILSYIENIYIDAITGIGAPVSQ